MTDQKNSPSKSGHQVPEKKRTTLGHYVTAEEAYAMWKNEPGMVHIIDVRTRKSMFLSAMRRWQGTFRSFL